MKYCKRYLRPNTRPNSKFSPEGVCPAWVITPFLTGIGSRVHAAMANRCFGVIPPKAMFGRS
jgi:hypothetical protein